MEISVPPGPVAVQSQINTQRLILIINSLANGPGLLLASSLLIINPFLLNYELPRGCGSPIMLWYVTPLAATYIHSIQKDIPHHLLFSV